MPKVGTWPTPSPQGGREEAVSRLSLAAREGLCSSLVGMSNIGKSYTLRAFCQSQTLAEQSGCLPVYVDCNRIVEFSDQGLYELILRCLRAILPESGHGSLGTNLSRCYEDVVAPSSPFLVHLRFSDALSMLCEGGIGRLVLALDGFDEVMRSIDDRVLLNLRALRDAYPGHLAYITATRHRLDAYRHSHGAVEFAEPFSRSVLFLGPLASLPATALVGQWVGGGDLPLTPDDMPFLMEETGGHPGLLAAAADGLGRLRHEAMALGRPLSMVQVREQLDSNPACQSECAKLWHDMDAEERSALVQGEPMGREDVVPPNWQPLLERYLVRRTATGLEPFCRLFASFLHRRRVGRQSEARGVRVDVEAGEVWVEGRRLPPLTELEYRLLLLLYGRLDRVVDKYAVVESVWGQDYMDEVDDARIEKLVSRLRQKIEADPAHPRYLQTVRGRGYRLVSA